MFDPIRDKVNRLFEKLTNEVNSICEAKLQHYLSAVNKLNIMVIDNSQVTEKSVLQDFQSEFNQLRILLRRNSFFDALDAKSFLVGFNKKLKKYIHNIEECFLKLDKQINREIEIIQIREAERTLKKREKFNQMRYSFLLWVIILLPLFVSDVLDVSNSNKNDVVSLFYVPFIVVGLPIIHLAKRQIIIQTINEKNIDTDLNTQKNLLSKINSQLKETKNISYELKN